jgi:hypothetical protein
MAVVKVVGSEISIAAPSSVANAHLVRVVATATGILTVANTGGTIGTVTIVADDPTFIAKNPTDTVGGAGMVAAPVAYQN